MWEGLDEEERDWVLTAQRAETLNFEEARIHESLMSLYRRGFLQMNEKTKQLKLFSVAFGQYIEEYVKALETDYENIERRIRDGYFKLNIEDVGATLDHLQRLKIEWKRREKKGLPAGDTYAKCEHLTAILGDMLKLLESMIEYKGRTTGRIRQDAKSSRAVERSLSMLAEHFGQDEWFGQDDAKTVDIYTGKKLLDQLMEYLDEHGKSTVFGNGFDRILAVRVNYMKSQGWEKFNTFETEVENTYSRLVSVHDYSRATEILQMRQGRFVRWLSRRFFDSPLITVGLLILIPFFLANLAVSFIAPDLYNNSKQTEVKPDSHNNGEQAEANLTEATTSANSTKDPNAVNSTKAANWTETTIAGINMVWLFTILVSQGYLMWTMYKSALSERFCDLPGSMKLYRRSIMQNPVWWVIIGYFVCTWAISDKQGLSKYLGEHPCLTILAGFLIGLVTLLVVATAIRPKVIRMETALRRARYFCAVEYLKAFWVVMVLIAIVHVLASRSDELARFDFMNEIGKSADYSRYFPNKFKIFGMILSFPAVLTLSVVSPLIGLLKFVPGRRTV